MNDGGLDIFRFDDFKDTTGGMECRYGGVDGQDNHGRIERFELFECLIIFTTIDIDGKTNGS